MSAARMPGRIRLASAWRPHVPSNAPQMCSRAYSAPAPHPLGINKRELAKKAGAFTVLFTLVVGSARSTAGTTEAKEEAAVLHKRRMQALDSVERSARAVTEPGSDPEALPWDELKLGRSLRRTRLLPSDVGLDAGPEPPALEGPVSWTSVIMGRNWSSVAVRDKLQRAFSNAKQDMPLIGTGRSMSHDDEFDELERLQQAQVDDEQYAERLFAAYEALEEKRAREAADAARIAQQVAAKEAEERQRLQAEAKERQAAQMREMTLAYEKADMRELADEYEKRQESAREQENPRPRPADTSSPASPAPEPAPEAPRPPPPKRTYF